MDKERLKDMGKVNVALQRLFAHPYRMSQNLESEASSSLRVKLFAKFVHRWESGRQTRAQSPKKPFFECNEPKEPKRGAEQTR